MQGKNKLKGSRQAKPTRNLSLESLLQQAWLQSQRPKVYRRSEFDSPVGVPIVERASSRSSASQSPAPWLLSGADSGGAGDAEGSESYFHKTRPEALPVDFLRRLGSPELNCFSQKVVVKRSSSSTLNRSKPAVNDACSQDSNDSSRFMSSDECPVGMLSTLEDSLDGVDFEGPGDVLSAWTRKTESMGRTVLDELLTSEDLEAEKGSMQGTSAYLAMEKEIADLLVPNGAVNDTACEPKDADSEQRWCDADFLSNEEIDRMDISSTYSAMAEEVANFFVSEPPVLVGAERFHQENRDRVEAVPSDHLMTLKCIEGFTNMFSKHLQDVSTSDSNFVDITRWTNEDDEIESQFDDRWTPFLDGFNEISPETSNLDRVSNMSPSISMTELLYRCALAVSRGDASGNSCLAELHNHSSAFGSFMERMAHYYHEALLAKMSGIGEKLYTVLRNNHPSPATILRSLRLYIDNCPYIKVKHLISQASILDAFEGANRVHLLHYGIHMGVEHAALIHNLSMRPGGPPHFRLTGIEFPHPGDDPLKKLHAIGQRLEVFAKKWGVPFEYHALAGSNWELFTAKDFDLRKEEVLVVSSYKMHLISDEGVLGVTPRELLLRRIRSLNPKLFSLFVDNAACSAPFFMTRFRESVKHYSVIYEGVDIAMAPDAPERVILEREVFGREILNIVACEGQARIERAEPYRQWQNRMDRADFTHRPMKPSLRSKVKAMMASFHKDFGIGKDGGWILLGIRNHIAGAASVWEPKSVTRVKPMKTKQPRLEFKGPVY